MADRIDLTTVLVRLIPVVLLALCTSVRAQDQAAPPADSRDPIFYPGDTERAKPLANKLVRNILLDQKEIWTSPFHMHKKDAPLWIGFGAITAALIATDHRSSKSFENSQGQVTWGNRISNIGSVYTIIPVAAGFYLGGVLGNDPKARETGVLGAEAMIDTLIVVEVLKPIAGRNRPDSIDAPGRFFKGGSGFPSGHAIESWALASVVAHEYSHSKLVPIAAYGLAAVVSTARFAAQKHYASDIVAGGAVGWFIGTYVYRTHEDHALHHHAFGNPKIVPQVQPSERAYGLGIQFNP